MKYLIFVFLLETITLVKSYMHAHKGAWQFIDHVNISNNVDQKRYGISFYDNKKWREPKYPVDEWIEVPGGRCPKKWQKKWEDVKLAVDHESDFNYWFKWHGNMIHIEMEENFRNATTLWCHDVPLNAIETAFNRIIEEFVCPGNRHGVLSKISAYINCEEPVTYFLKNGKLYDM